MKRTGPYADDEMAQYCKRCGRADGLNAMVSDLAWETIRARADGANVLCLWCMDEIAAACGLTLHAVLHFAGRAISAGSLTREEEARIAEKLIIELRVRGIERELRARDEALRGETVT